MGFQSQVNWFQIVLTASSVAFSPEMCNKATEPAESEPPSSDRPVPSADNSCGASACRGRRRRSTA